MRQALAGHVKDFGLFHKSEEKPVNDFKKSEGGVSNMIIFAFKKKITVAAILRKELAEE